MGNIKVTVQTKERMTAITNLAIAIKHTAQALANDVRVEIVNNTIQTNKNGIVVNTKNKVTDTLIKD